MCVSTVFTSCVSRVVSTRTPESSYRRRILEYNVWRLQYIRFGTEHMCGRYVCGKDMGAMLCMYTCTHAWRRLWYWINKQYTLIN